MEIFKQPYEISLWTDILVFVDSNGVIHEDITKIQGASVVSQFYKEVKLCTIGSSSMGSLSRCINPKLTQKVNGENQLTFTMYYRYQDDMTGEVVENPFVKYMCNERKVKLRLGAVGDPKCQWFDFIIKNTQENSDSKAFTYTCKDQFVNELSKSGFEIELDNELENNMGTIDKLADSILEGSDWELDLEQTEILKQFVEEPMYEIVLNDAISAETMEKWPDQKVSKTFSAGSRVLVFYSHIVDEKDKIQFLFSEITDKDNQLVFSADDDLVIDKTEYPNWIATINPKTFIKSQMLSKYRGERLVKQLLTKYDATIDKFVNVYEKEGKEYYGFTKSEYSTSGAILNYAANPNNFSSTSGWQTDNNQLDYQLETYPQRPLTTGENYQTFLKFENKSKALVMNAGIGGHRSTIESLQAGDKYVLRIKYLSSLEPGADGLAYCTVAPKVKICEYDIVDGYYKTENFVEIEGESESQDAYKIFDFSQTTLGGDDLPARTNTIEEQVDEYGNGTGQYEYLDKEDSNYIYMIATCSRSISKKELTDWDFRVGLFFEFESLPTSWIYIEDVEVFPYLTQEDNGETRLCVPNGKLLSETKTKYFYYQRNTAWKSMDDFVPVETAYAPIKEYVQVYGTNSLKEGTNEFTKVRSISAKESNRFNLIQELCETFECWPRFRVDRDMTTGEIIYERLVDDEGNISYRQKKYLSFHEYTGDSNHIGFRYGVNSKSIQRTVDSANIVTKMIVKDNANEFAPNGFCSIARASDNPIGENFILSFEQYYRHGLLDRDVVTNDLYNVSGGYLGYYTKLKEANAVRDENIDKQAGRMSDIARYDSAYTTYKTSFDSAVEEQLIVEYDTSKYLLETVDRDNFATRIPELMETDEYKNDTELLSYWTKWCQCENIIVNHGPLYKIAKQNLDQATAEYEEIAQYLKKLNTTKQALGLQFYKKYSRFIQEGSWTKEDYTDPNLYYLDAVSTLHTSTQPKVTYNISVIDVEPLGQQEQYKGLEHYHFDVGDKTFIEDVEFFGRSLHANGAPYREEVVVSEIATELDAPEKTQIKVQNYKNQFEDLFQRITAQTQQAEYHTGEYARAASVVEADGTISVSAIQASLENNSMRLANAHDQSVVWNSSGITATNLHNPSEMVRIISGGIFLSNDGGQSWRTGITGGGINTAYLTAGQINTDKIYIMNGDNAAFRWDNLGLAAYFKNDNSYTRSKFVRFDHNGIYGIIANEDWSGKDEDIHDSASFALTWSGFSLKNNNGSVRISSDHDIQVLKENKERIKIGRLDKSEDPSYGIRIMDSSGNRVMETDSEGRLWLRDELSIGSGESSMVKIGYLKNTRRSSSVREVIHAGDGNTSFIVYEDGKLNAMGVDITGTINATGGSIGGVNIANIDFDDYEILIQSDGGTVVNQNKQVTLTAHIYKNGEPYTGAASFQWYSGTGSEETAIENETDMSLVVQIDFGSEDYKQYRCEVTIAKEESE